MQYILKIFGFFSLLALVYNAGAALDLNKIHSSDIPAMSSAKRNAIRAAIQRAVDDPGYQQRRGFKTRIAHLMEALAPYEVADSRPSRSRSPSPARRAASRRGSHSHFKPVSISVSTLHGGPADFTHKLLQVGETSPKGIQVMAEVLKKHFPHVFNTRSSFASFKPVYHGITDRKSARGLKMSLDVTSFDANQGQVSGTIGLKTGDGSSLCILTFDGDANIFAAAFRAQHHF